MRRGPAAPRTLSSSSGKLTPPFNDFPLACRYSPCGHDSEVATEVSVSNLLSRVFQRQSLRGNVRRALESGVGLSHASWDIEAAMTASTSSDLA